MRIICSSGYLSHSEPLFKKLNVLKIGGMFKLQLFTFCFDLINKNLPAYFINKSSLLQPVIYHHNIRQKINYSVARVKHVFAQKCMRFCIPDNLNKSSSLITDEIKTHSRKGYYYILYPCSPLILTFVIYLVCVSVLALIHRLHSYLSASPCPLMVLFYYWPSFCLSVFPVCSFSETIYITLLKGGGLS